MEVRMVGASVRRPLVMGAMLLALAVFATPGHAQTGQIKGKVVDAKNAPVEGATVLIESSDGMNRKYQVKTNKRGEYIQIGIQGGEYKITASKEALTQTFTRKLSGVNQTEVNFTLMPGGGGGEISEEDRKKAEARIAGIKAAFEAGVTLSNEGKHDEAIAKFNEVLVAAPKCIECYTNIGAVQTRKKDYDAAEASYKKALELKPDSFEAYSGLATVYNQQKKFDLAAEASAQAQKYGAALAGGAGGAASASTVFNQGVIAWNSNKISEAKKLFEQAVQLDPKLADAHYWLGMANLNEGKMPDAAKSFDEYLKLAPTGQYAEQAKGILAQIKK
jgi:tetratricopeptide (TPR) repeat protein